MRCCLGLMKPHRRTRARVNKVCKVYKTPISLEELAFHWEGAGIGFVKPFLTRSWFGSYGNVDVEAPAARHTSLLTLVRHFSKLRPS